MGWITGANTGARILAQRLAQGGARFGIVVTSARDQFVSVRDFSTALDDLAARIRADRARAPLLIVYFAGHGITEGVAWNHFSLPGDFVYRGDIARLDIEGLSARTLHATELVERLKALRLPYVLLLDTCYEGEEATFQTPVLTGPAVESLRSIAGVLRFMNEFRQGEPVLFSTAPGTVVTTVPDPTNPKGDPVGPLARRAVLLLDTAVKGRTRLSVAAFVQGLTDARLDSETKPAVTYAQKAPWWRLPLTTSLTAPGRVEARTGTAVGPGEACCSPPAAPHSVTAVLTGRVEFAGPARDYITGGQRIAFDTHARWTAHTAGPGDLTLRTETSAGAAWEVSLSTPRGAPFVARRYAGAVRHGFAHAEQPGLAVTGDGRACNESQGEFTIQEFSFAPDGKLRRLRATLRQRCDGSPAWLTGTIDLSLASGH
jgi:hypothetical protein